MTELGIIMFFLGFAAHAVACQAYDWLEGRIRQRIIETESFALPDVGTRQGFEGRMGEVSDRPSPSLLRPDEALNPRHAPETIVPPSRAEPGAERPEQQTERENA